MVETLDLQHLRIERRDGVATVWMARPEVHNAFDAELIEELTASFMALTDDDTTRVVVLGGDGPSFCAGADINWMRDSIEYTRQQNVEDATNMARMLTSIARCRKPVVARVHGRAIGGGAGLLCAADYVVASSDAQFAFSEVKLGIVPAVISPFVVNRIGPGHARALFLTGERFSAERACTAGLAHVVVEPDELDGEVERVTRELMTSAPDAIAVVKRLIGDVSYKHHRETLGRTVETIATKRTDPEGQEGLTAFLERRRPNWIQDPYQPSWLPPATRSRS